VKVTENATLETPFPFGWQPRANWHRIEVRFEIDAPILPDSCVCLCMNAFFATQIRCKVDIVNRHQCLGDEKMRAAEIQIGKQSHLQPAAGGNVFKIRSVRRNEQLCSEKSGLLAAKSPGYVGVIRFNLFQIDSFGQENGKPWLGCHCFRIRFVNLNLDVAGLHAHVAEPPLPHKEATRIKRCRDATSIE
jgi:hypothetical protein